LAALLVLPALAALFLLALIAPLPALLALTALLAALFLLALVGPLPALIALLAWAFLSAALLAGILIVGHRHLPC
jgi:hypothetical protein